VFGPRKADGSLPDVKFLHLSAGSTLIDKGTNVGLPFSGKAPDLGAFEFGATDIVREPVVPQAPRVGVSGDIQNMTLYDIAGRRVESNPMPHASGLLIFKALEPDGRVKAYTAVVR
jgi:hypothetical protein